MSKNSEYFNVMHTQLKKWDADLDALDARSHTATIAVLAAFHENAKRLRENRDAAYKTLEDIRFAGESAGALMQANMNSAWKAMQDDLARTSQDLRT